MQALASMREKFLPINLLWLWDTLTAILVFWYLITFCLLDISILLLLLLVFNSGVHTNIGVKEFQVKKEAESKNEG